MDGTTLGKVLIGLGLLALVTGTGLLAGVRFPFGQLPGDINTRRGNIGISFPIVTCLVLSLGASLLLTVILNLINRK